MAFTYLESIRTKIGDRPKLNREQLDNTDGTTDEFELSYSPIVASPAPTVMIGGVPKTQGVDYTLDYENGIVAFTVAPAANTEVIIQYTSVVWSDAEIDDFYSTSNSSLLLASARILYAWSARLSVDAIKESRSGGGGMGAITLDTSVRAREMRATADALKREYDQFEGVGEAAEGVTELVWTEQMDRRVIIDDWIKNLS